MPDNEFVPLANPELIGVCAACSGSDSQESPKPVPNPSRGLNHNSTGSGPVFEIRTASGLSQLEFARALGVSKSLIEKCEARGNWPGTVAKQAAVLRFARELGVEVGS